MNPRIVSITLRIASMRVSVLSGSTSGTAGAANEVIPNTDAITAVTIAVIVFFIINQILSKICKLVFLNTSYLVYQLYPTKKRMSIKYCKFNELSTVPL